MKFFKDTKLECLQGQHRALAAKQILPLAERWWTIELYGKGKCKYDLIETSLIDRSRQVSATMLDRVCGTGISTLPATQTERFFAMSVAVSLPVTDWESVAGELDIAPQKSET